MKQSGLLVVNVVFFFFHFSCSEKGTRTYGGYLGLTLGMNCLCDNIYVTHVYT